MTKPFISTLLCHAASHLCTEGCHAQAAGVSHLSNNMNVPAVDKNNNNNNGKNLSCDGITWANGLVGKKKCMIRERRVIRWKKCLENEIEGSSRSSTVFGEKRQREGRQKTLFDLSFWKLLNLLHVLQRCEDPAVTDSLTIHAELKKYKNNYWAYEMEAGKKLMIP